MQISGIRNFQRTAFAWFLCPEHGRASPSTGVLKAVQIIGDDIFIKVQVLSARSKVHGLKHTRKVHYSSCSLKAQKSGFEEDFLVRAAQMARVWTWRWKIAIL